jgi:hypothetical protein
LGSESQSRIGRLEKEGWVRQFVASEPRLSEAVELYRESGFDVHLEPLPKGGECDTCAGVENRKEQGACRVCFDGFEDQYKMIFTRRRKDSKPKAHPHRPPPSRQRVD